jgi:hypothetical protein
MKSSGVAARPRQAIDEARADRITEDREHDRHCAGCLQQWPHGGGSRGQDDVRCQRDQFRRVSAKDLSNRSNVVAELKTYKAFRVYHAADDEEAKRKITDIMEAGIGKWPG